MVGLLVTSAMPAAGTASAMIETPRMMSLRIALPFVIETITSSA